MHPKHIVDKIWKQWCIKGGKKSEEDGKEETTLANVNDKANEKGKGGGKGKDRKGKKKATITCNHCGVKGHIEDKCWKKDLSQMPEKFQSKKTEKAGAAVEEEHFLSNVNICDDFSIFCVDTEAAYVLAPITSTDNGFGNVTDYEDILDLETPTKTLNIT
jgi:hypothetical protein